MESRIEINSLVILPDRINTNDLAEGQRLQFTRKDERTIPLQTALLMIDQDWNFYGYCRVISLQTTKGQTQVEIEVLILFTKDEVELYKNNFMKAGRMTGEVEQATNQ